MTDEVHVLGDPIPPPLGQRVEGLDAVGVAAWRGVWFAHLLAYIDHQQPDALAVLEHDGHRRYVGLTEHEVWDATEALEVRLAFTRVGDVLRNL